MATFLRIAGYTFISLSGMYAWLSIESGWRHYLGLGIFFFGSLRIMILLFPQRPKNQNAASNQPPDDEKPAKPQQ